MHPQTVYDLTVSDQQRAIAARSQEHRAALARRARASAPPRPTAAQRRTPPRRSGRG